MLEVRKKQQEVKEEMKDKEREELRKQFYKAKRAAIKHHVEGAKFNKMTEDYFGYHYSEYDIDEVIDCLMYGINGGLFFKGFMDNMKNKGKY